MTDSGLVLLVSLDQDFTFLANLPPNLVEKNLCSKSDAGEPISLLELELLQ